MKIPDEHGHSTRSRYDEPTAAPTSDDAATAAATTYDAVASPLAAADGHGQQAGIQRTLGDDAQQTAAPGLRAPGLDGRPSPGEISLV